MGRMSNRLSNLALILSALAFMGLTEASAAPSPKANSTAVADEAIKDVRYEPASVKPRETLSPEISTAAAAETSTLPVPSVDLLPVVPATAGNLSTELSAEPARLENLEAKPGAVDSESLHLSPYIVRDLPNRTYQNVNEAISQQRRLGQSRQALYKKNLSRNVQMQFAGVPYPGGVTGISANLPLLRLSW
jgi:hypothetical protein